MEDENDPIFVNESKVRAVLTWPLVNEAVEQALQSVCRQETVGDLPYSNQPARSFTFSEGNKGILLTMPGFIGNYSLCGRSFNTLACKLVTSFQGNAQRNPPLPNILANILLFDSITGKLLCVMEGTEITAWRTAAASIVATKHLYFGRNPEKKGNILSILGCGVQGSSHAVGFCSSFENIKEIRLWNRTPKKAENLANELEETRKHFLNKELRIVISPTAEDCVSQADIIVTATFSSQAFLHAHMVKSDVHINAIGAGENHHSEISEELYEKSSVYIDNWTGAKNELKDLKANIVCEVGEIITGTKTPNPGITIFQSMGMASEDATVAQAVYEVLKP